MPATTEINSFSQDLKDLLAKHKLADDQVASFRLLRGAEQLRAKNSEGDNITIARLPRAYRLPRMEGIIDPGTKRPITLANLKGYAPSAIAGQADQPIIGNIVFTDENEGQINVTSADPVLYERLLLSDFNRDNPNPSRRVPENGFLFGLVKPDSEAETKVKLRFARSKAVSAVEDLTADELAEICQKLNLPTELNRRQLGENELRLALVNSAEEDPARVQSVLDAGERQLEKLIADAVEHKLITFVGEANEWRWVSNQTLITTATIGFAPETALIGFIQSGGENAVKFSQNLTKAVAAKTKKR